MKKLRLCLVAAMAAIGLNGAMAQTTVTFGNNYVIADGMVPGEIALNDGTYDEENLHADGYPPSTGYPAEAMVYTSGSLTMTTYLPRANAASERAVYVDGEFIPVFQLGQIADTDISVFGKGNAIISVDATKDITVLYVNGSRNSTSGKANVAAAFCDREIFDATKVTGVEAVTLPTRLAPENAVKITVPAGTKSILLAAKIFYMEPADGEKYNTIVIANTEGVKSKGGNVRTNVAYISITYKAISATIPEAGITTFSSATPVTFDDSNVEVYTVNSAKDGKAGLVQLTGTIPAGEGVILKGTPGTYTYTDEASGPDNVEGNLLVGCPTPTTVPTDANTTYYILSLNAGGDADSAGFYYYNEEGAGDFAVPAGKAYLPINNTVASGAPARFALSFDDGSATGLEVEVSSQNDNAPVDVYSIDGCLIRSNVMPGEALQGLSKGMYIVNGKKNALY